MTGKILGNRYELIKKIGAGGMAIVYKAKCRLLNRMVAIKILRNELIEDQEFVSRFNIESQAAASLSHSNIVSIYDVGRQDDIHYIVMEYIDGETLKDCIVRNGALNWKDAVNYAIQICSALEHAHRKQIVHRDIKPHNIMVTKEGVLKVTDFGVARAVTSSTLTLDGNTIGSVHYFSPEQARGGYTDEKSDLYSLGVVLYEMVTGKLPFESDTPVSIALKHLQEKPREPMELEPGIPTGLNNIIIKTNYILNLPFNVRLKENARKLRKAENFSEVVFWKQVRNKEFWNLDFDRQRIIGNYIVDFYVKSLGLVIEIDGESHNDKEEYDNKRNTYLTDLGLKIYRISKYRVLHDLNNVMLELENYIIKQYQ